MLCDDVNQLDTQVGDRINNLLARTEGLTVVSSHQVTKTTTTATHPVVGVRHTSVQQIERQSRVGGIPPQSVLVENTNSNLVVENQRLVIELQKSANTDQRMR
jgi:hypothetical protein